MLSNKANYDIEQAKEEIKTKKLMADLKVETQTILQLLVAKGIVTREEVAETRCRVKNSPGYRETYAYLDSASEKANFYQNNPAQHLKDLFNAKMSGDIR